MAFATVHSCTLSGVTALPVAVEVHTSGGLPGTSLVGLPQSAVRESKDRVRAAIENSEYNWPQQRIIINLAPADLPKDGGRFDLPIALGVLLATGQLPEHCLNNLVVLGELGLNGEMRSVSGILPTSYAHSSSDVALLLPWVNAAEALRSSGTSVHAFGSLQEVCDALKARTKTPLKPLSHKDVSPCVQFSFTGEGGVDMSDVYGQHKARRALEIAAAGSHNLLMVGPPGTGKSMLAGRLPTIQPKMTETECMETASVASISHNGFIAQTWGVRPFRAPHHTASGIALVGGGSIPKPGEISLAHNGVLFLDELPEFSRTVLDVLREPMETGEITLSRAARQATYPSRFQLVAAMNPCPCGYYNDPNIQCRCGVEQIIRYQSRISGPFLDRIDLHLSLQREVHVDGVLKAPTQNESSDAIRARVLAATSLQRKRQSVCNSQLNASALREHANLDAASRALLAKASKSLSLSLRAQHRLLRVARTIADLGDAEYIDQRHLAESLSFRSAPVVDSL